MRNRFVKVERAARPDGYVWYSFRPVELRNGNLYDLGASSSDWREAFAVIDAIEAREVRT